MPQQKGLRGHLFEDQSIDFIKLKTSGYTPSDSYDLVNIQYFNTHTLSGNTYQAGNGISISANTISYTGQTGSNYVGGNGISISGNVISYTGTTNSSLGYFIVDKFIYLGGNPVFTATQNIGTLIGVEQRGVNLIPNDQFNITLPSTIQILTGNTSVRSNDIFIIKYFTGTGSTIQQNVINNYYSGGTYQAGNSISISGNVISYTGQTGNNYYGGSFVNIDGSNNINVTGVTPLNYYVGVSGISVNGNVISYTGSNNVNFIGGTGIQITGNIINYTGSTGNTYFAGNNLLLSGNTFNVTGLTPLNYYVPGNSISISGNVISYTGQTISSSLDQQIIFNSNNNLTGNTSFTYNAINKRLNFGNNNQITGSTSIAFGNSLVAGGNLSQAFGFQNQALGNYSQAFGQNAKAIGDYSHASGANTTASGLVAYAEGNGSISSGNSSHAEGTLTVASGDYSHAEGRQGIASGIYSHAEGYQTQASNAGSHAEGFQTYSLGVGSHSQGYQTFAYGNYSHASGSFTRANGTGSFVHQNISDPLNPTFAYADNSAILGGGITGFTSTIPSGNTGSVLLGNSNFVVPSGFTYTTFVKNLYVLNSAKPIIIKNSGGTESYISVDNNNQLNFNGNVIQNNLVVPPTSVSTSGTTVISGVTCQLATFDCKNLADSMFKITSDDTNLTINLTNAPEGAFILIKLERTTIGNINIYFTQDTYLQSNSQSINKGQSPLICKGHVGGNTVALLAIYRGTVNSVLSSLLKFTEDTQV